MKSNVSDMNALIYFFESGKWSKFDRVSQLKEADVKPGEILVRVFSFALNPVDYKKPSLQFKSSLAGHPIGQDFSGEVVFSKSSEFAAGDFVFGTAKRCAAELLICTETSCVKKPDTLTHLEAASLVTVAQTGLQAMRKVKLTEGSRVLVVGASGGCGLAGVQLARSLVGKSGKVIGICSAANSSLVEALKVTDAVLDYGNEAKLLEDLSLWGKFDCVYDTVSSWEKYDTLGGRPYAQALSPFLSPNGMIVAINGSTWQWLGAIVGWQAPRYCLFMQEPSLGDLEKTVELVGSGCLKPCIDSVHPFTADGCRTAYERLKSRRAKGKICVEVVPS